MSELNDILSFEPKYRQEQVAKAWFDVRINGYDEITTLPVELRKKLKNVPWLSVDLVNLQESKIDSTKKALLKLSDGEYIETVLMGRENTKLTREESERHTICISTQSGCPMRCVFCATGKSGFKRNLTTEEIVDQCRFWKKNNRIANIVVMGQGEPLLNYDNLKKALNTIIVHAEIGPTKITVSTCGVMKAMDKLLEDKNFPQIRWALSLHSAIEETRAMLMPFHQEGFLKYFIEWAEKYHKFIPSRTHFIGLEYILFDSINDDERHLRALIKFAKKMPRVRINLIPYNLTTHDTRNTIQEEFVGLFPSPSEVIKRWHDALMKTGFVCTIRRSQGQDIAAACGQLRNLGFWH